MKRSHSKNAVTTSPKHKDHAISGSKVAHDIQIGATTILQPIITAHQSDKMTREAIQSTQPQTAPLVLHEGYSLVNQLTKAQKRRKKNNQNIYEDVVNHDSITFYPQWKGNLRDLLAYPSQADFGHNYENFRYTNTNSIAARLGPLTINFYPSTGSFQITGGRASPAFLRSQVDNLKQYLANHTNMNADLSGQFVEFCEGLKNHTPIENQQANNEPPVPTTHTTQEAKMQSPAKTKTDLEGTSFPTLISRAYDRTYGPTIKKGYSNPQTRALYAPRLTHAPIIWDTIGEQFNLHGSFKGFTTWYDAYTKEHLSNQTGPGKTWFKNHGPKMLDTIKSIFRASSSMITIPQLEPSTKPLQPGAEAANQTMEDVAASNQAQRLQALEARDKAMQQALKELAKNAQAEKEANGLEMKQIQAVLKDLSQRISDIENAPYTETESEDKPEPQPGLTRAEVENLIKAIEAKVEAIHTRNIPRVDFTATEAKALKQNSTQIGQILIRIAQISGLVTNIESELSNDYLANKITGIISLNFAQFWTSTTNPPNNKRKSEQSNLDEVTILKNPTPTRTIKATAPTSAEPPQNLDYDEAQEMPLNDENTEQPQTSKASTSDALYEALFSRQEMADIDSALDTLIAHSSELLRKGTKRAVLKGAFKHEDFKSRALKVDPNIKWLVKHQTAWSRLQGLNGATQTKMKAAGLATDRNARHNKRKN